jgi:hypothetical protein
MPVEVHPVVNPGLPESGQIVQVESEQVLLLHAGIQENGITLRLANLGDGEAQVKVRLPGIPVVEAWWLDSLGGKNAPLQVEQGVAKGSLPGRAVRNMMLTLSA